MPPQSSTVNIATEHNKSFDYPITTVTTIADIKKIILDYYGLALADQYYTVQPRGGDILADNELVWNTKRKLLLRIDSYLTQSEMEYEADKIVMEGGKDMLGKYLGRASGSVVSVVGQAGIEVGSVVHKDVRKRQLRMWKRANAERIRTKGRYGSGPVGLFAQAMTNSGNMLRNVWDGTLNNELGDNGAGAAYLKVGD